jgi:hypothetical protein
MPVAARTDIRRSVLRLLAVAERRGNIGDREQSAAQRKFFGVPAGGEKALIARCYR